MIRIVGKRGKGSFASQLDDAAKGVEFVTVDCTSGNADPVMREGLSPFFLGPIDCYDGLKAELFECAWQCAKVYPWAVDAAGNPDSRYFAWRDAMWGQRVFTRATDLRYPVGKANVGKCLYAWWKVDGEYRKLDYIGGRKHIYLPLYAKAVVKTEAYRRLCALRDSGKNLLLLDFDGYNPHHPRYDFTYNDVIHCPVLKMGHGFVLAMLLEGVIRVEDGEVKYDDGLMTPPARYYSSDLRKLSEEAKLERNAKTLGVTIEEYGLLDETTRKLLHNAAKKEACYARGFTKIGWKRLPLSEKLAHLER